mmetsp:Transcript_13/g.62  ORF Transcript_13/g.62 Transcript_13/m.62 type:complete len:467 (-) Transcript_13:1000-2400(-)
MTRPKGTFSVVPCLVYNKMRVVARVKKSPKSHRSSPRNTWSPCLSGVSAGTISMFTLTSSGTELFIPEPKDASVDDPSTPSASALIARAEAPSPATPREICAAVTPFGTSMSSGRIACVSSPSSPLFRVHATTSTFSSSNVTEGEPESACAICAASSASKRPLGDAASFATSFAASGRFVSGVAFPDAAARAMVKMGDSRSPDRSASASAARFFARLSAAASSASASRLRRSSLRASSTARSAPAAPPAAVSRNAVVSSLRRFSASSFGSVAVSSPPGVCEPAPVSFVSREEASAAPAAVVTSPVANEFERIRASPKPVFDASGASSSASSRYACSARCIARTCRLTISSSGLARFATTEVPVPLSPSSIFLRVAFSTLREELFTKTSSEVSELCSSPSRGGVASSPKVVAAAGWAFLPVFSADASSASSSASTSSGSATVLPSTRPYASRWCHLPSEHSANSITA